MVCDNHMWVGRMPLQIAVGTLLVFLVDGGGASALSNGGGGSKRYSREISSSPGAASAVDDGESGCGV